MTIPAYGNQIAPLFRRKRKKGVRHTRISRKRTGKTEELIKKLCLAEPKHHAGFEGLAYVYYVAEEFEKAEWFMEEALKRARRFIKEGAIDLEVIEMMEENRDRPAMSS